MARISYLKKEEDADVEELEYEPEKAMKVNDSFTNLRSLNNSDSSLFINKINFEE